MLHFSPLLPNILLISIPYVWGRAQTSRFLVSCLLSKFFELLFSNCQNMSWKKSHSIKTIEDKFYNFALHLRMVKVTCLSALWATESLLPRKQRKKECFSGKFSQAFLYSSSLKEFSIQSLILNVLLLFTFDKSYLSTCNNLFNTNISFITILHNKQILIGSIQVIFPILQMSMNSQ